jgi:hypothetical protein
LNIYVPLPTQPKLLLPTPYVCRKVEGYQNLWQPTDDELSPKDPLSPHAGVKRVFYWSPPSATDEEPESPATCVVCKIRNKARHLYLCDEKNRNGKICDAPICRWCSTREGLPQGEFWNTKEAPAHLKAQCLKCNVLVNTRKKLRSDEERAPKFQQQPHEMITIENTMKALKRAYDIVDSFIDPMTGTVIPITKGDNRDGSFSHAMVDTFLQIDKDGPFAIHKGKKIYENVKAVPEDELDLSEWNNLEAYCDAYYAKVEKEAIDAGFSPASDDGENNADDEADEDMLEEEVQVHDGNLKGESNEEMSDEQASDKATASPDNVLNGPFGGPAHVSDTESE